MPVIFKECDLFKETYMIYINNDAQLIKKYDDFLAAKGANPNVRFGKRDYQLSGRLKGKFHAHLSGNVIIVYKRLGQNIFHLFGFFDHDDFKSNNEKSLADRLNNQVFEKKSVIDQILEADNGEWSEDMSVDQAIAKTKDALGTK